MLLAKNRIGYLFLVGFFCLLLPNTVNADNNHEIISPLKDNISPTVLSQTNHNIIPLGKSERLNKPWMWGNDVLVASGSISGGFSTDYDTFGNTYAVRCTTYNAHDSSGVRIYKSSDGGASWSVLNGFGDASGVTKFSYPVILTRNKLYVFYLASSQNGDIGVARFSQNGTTWEGAFNVKVDADTITYFSVCTDDGSHLMVVYQKDENQNNIHKIYTITSTDSGATWGNETQITDDGQHPDMAYGNNGYVYLVWESALKVTAKSWIPYYEIKFRNSTDYCAPASWQGIQTLTDDDYDDHYPKVAALHTFPADTACVWVAYNHETSNEEKDTLKYDDGSVLYHWRLPDQYGTDFFNVRFTPPGDYWLESAQFLFYRKTGTGGVRVYVWANTSGFPAQKIDSVDVPNDSIKPYPTWTIVNFLTKGIDYIPAADFHIGYTLLGPPMTDSISITSDDGLPVGTEHRSMDFYNGAWETIYSGWGGNDANFMIRTVVGRVTSTDLRFAYSTNSGADWSKNHELANSGQANEMATDLKVYRSSSNPFVDLCYLKAPVILKTGWDICYTWTDASYPESFYTPHVTINDHWSNLSPDSRDVCQLTYPLSGLPGILYAGELPLKNGEESLLDGGWNLYFDYHGWSGVEDETEEDKLPLEFSLSNNFPNPFNPETRIQFSVASRQTKTVNGSQFTVHNPLPTSLIIYNVLGQKVRTLVNEPKGAGTYEVIWDGRDEKGREVASGVYFYRLQAGDFAQTKKMVLIK